MEKKSNLKVVYKDTKKIKNEQAAQKLAAILWEKWERKKKEKQNKPDHRV